jgi:hypothetical protein
VGCHPKHQGGLGIQDLQVEDTTLLEKWVMLSTNDGYEKNLVRKKSMLDQRHYPSFIEKFGAQAFVASLMAKNISYVLDHYYQG